MTHPSPPRIEKILPLTPLQRFMLGLALRDDEGFSDPYVIQTWGRLMGDFDADSVRRAWAQLVQRHAALRCAFVNQGQREPRQVVLEQGHWVLDELDWRDNTSPFEPAFEALRAQQRQQRFDLVRPPLLRLSLVRVSDHSAWFLLTNHHLILDGWSQQIVLDEFQRLLEAELRGVPLELPPAVGPEHLLQRFQGAPSPALDAYWHRTLAGWTHQHLPRPALHPDHHVRPGSVRPSDTLPASVVQALERRAREWRVTPGTLAAAAWALCLARVQGIRQVTFGLTLSGRDGTDAASQAVGMFVNTLPLRIDCQPGQTLTQFVQQTAAALRALTEHDNVDLSRLQRLAGAGPDKPLFDSLVAFENFPSGPALTGPLRVLDLQSDERTSLAAALVVVPSAQSWRLALQADTQWLQPELAQALLTMACNTLRQISRDETLAVGTLLDRLPLPAALPSTPLWPALNTGDSLQGRFLARAQQQPSHPAIRVPDEAVLNINLSQSLSYSELEQASRRVAAALVARGVAPSDRVALCAERGADLLVTMLGILRAGACYVPVDPHQPAERQQAILADSRPVLVISDQGHAQAVTPAELIAEQAAAADTGWHERPACPDAAAYIIYTSGSTGRPKGVVVSHANVLALMAGSEGLFAVGPNDLWSFFHSFAFDFSVWEIWGAWLTGGTVLVVPHATSRDPEAFVSLCQREGVSVLSQTPSAFTAFEYAQETSACALPALRYVVFGGEALGAGALQRWRRRFAPEQPQMINMYGITETTVHVTFHEVVESDLAAAALLPLGPALPHLSLALLDRFGRQVVPQGVGEIAVGGAGVSQGYFDAPRLTAERFVPDPLATRPGQRRYLSGDLAQRDGEGALRPLGRADRQVKVRGFRIELGEIEHALLRVPGIRNAVAGTWNKASAQASGLNQSRDGSEMGGEAGQLGLCAWIVLDTTQNATHMATDEAWLREQLASRLPAYMVPERFVTLSAIPLTANGKTDTARLSLPERSVCPALATTPLDPATEALTHTLCQIWAEALQVPEVGPEDNYFSLGGDSIRSLRVIALARSRQLALPIARLYQNPTPRSLAQWLTAPAARAVADSGSAPAEPLPPFHTLSPAERAALPPQAQDAWPATRLQMGMLFNADQDAQPGRYLDIFSFELRLQGTPEGLQAAVQALVQRHPVLRSSFLLAEARLLQVVHRRCLNPLHLRDLRGLPPSFQQEALQAEFEALNACSLDATRPELFQIRVSRLDDTRWNAVFLLHHAILDGWSFALVCAELFEAWAQDGPADAQASPGWQSWLAESEQRALADPALRQRWQQRLANLPADDHLWPWPQPQARSVRARPGRALRVLPTELLERLQSRAQASGLPLKSWLLAAFAHVLGWSTGQAAVAVGLVSSCRPSAEQADRAVGMFLNTVPARCPSQGSWLALARQAQQAENEGLDDRFLPLAELVRLQGRSPFQATFNFVNFRPSASVRHQASHEPTRSRELTEIEVAMTFSLSPDGRKLHAEMALAERYPQAQAEWLADRVADALHQMCANPEARAQLHDPMSSAPTCLHAPLPDDALEAPWRTVLRRLARHPDAIVAVTDDGVALSGAELLHSLLAQVRTLRTLGPLHGCCVALALPRGLEAVTAMVAAQALGAWTVVLDLQAPASRSQAILDDTPGAVLLYHSQLASGMKLQARVQMDLAAQPAQRPGPEVAAAGSESDAALLDDLLNAPQAQLATAYGIYTSGSTGRPKGVLVSQRALAAHMLWMNTEFGLGPQDRVLFRTRPSFDASVWEIWAPLMTGAQLVVAPSDASNDPGAIAQAVVLRRITVLQLVPSLLEVMTEGTEAQALQRLRLLMVGGEALKLDTVRRLGEARPFELINLYGPSETTVDATFDRVPGADTLADLGSTPIGRPIAGSQAWVVDEHLSPLPVGAAGELLLGGACVGLGYLNAAAQTGERYVPAPFGPAGARAFRTRDRVRRLPDGRLLFLSRLDRQVKLGGNRVELEEIESVLAPLHPQGRVAVGLQTLDGLDRLVAFLEDADTLAAGAWREALMQQLPGYMVPAVYRRVPQWPSLASGKTDRSRLWEASLPWTGADRSGAETSDGAPPAGLPADVADPESTHPALDELQQFLSRLLARPVGPDDDFFALGGDSILAMQLVAKARQAGWQLRPKEVFQQRTLRQMARQMALQATQVGGPDPLTEPPAGPWTALPAQAWFLRRPWVRPQHWNQVVALALSPGVSAHALRQALQTLGHRHRALGTRVGLGMGLHSGDAQPLLQELRCPGRPEVRRAAVYTASADLQAGLDLGKGPVWGALTVVDAAGQALECILAVHHLVIDGVSWRVLFDELQALLSGQALPPPPPSAPALATHLQQQALDPVARAHWDQLAQALAARPARPVWGPEGSSHQVRRVLDRDDTAALLALGDSRWRARPEALLSAALLLAIGRQQGRQTLMLAVERHGRDLLGSAASERSVGWFTRLYPWLADTGAATDLPTALRLVKASQAAWADLQADWLAATQVRPDAATLPDPDAVINFLGSFDSSFGADALLRPLDHELAPSQDPANPRTSGLDLVGLVSEGQLRLSMSCDGTLPAAHAEALLQDVADTLSALARGRLVGHAWLDSDLPWLQTHPAEIEDLWARHPQLRAILPATPAQEGMVFTQQRDGLGQGVYVQQLEIQLRGTVSLAEVQERFRHLGLRHEALRTSFELSGNGQVLQLVHARAEMPVTAVQLPAQAESETAWQAFVQADARRGFELSQAPLSRVSVLTGPTSSRVLWTHHHLIMDGWSLPIVLHELSLDAAALQALPAPASRAPFWDWLVTERAPDRQQQRQAEWQRRYAGHSPAPRLAEACRAPQRAHPSGRARLSLPPTRLQQLREFARLRQLTLSTLVAAAWGLVLSRLLRCDDLSVGMVTSGRPAGVSASGQWVGMFVNTLPLRLQVHRHAELGDWLASVQAQVIELTQHSQDSLAEVRSWTGVGELFETIVVFQNYPLTPPGGQASGPLPIERVLAEERNEYPLSLYADQQEGLQFTLRFDPQRIGGPLAEGLLAAVAQALSAWSSGETRHLGSTDLLGPQRLDRLRAERSPDPDPELAWLGAGILAQARARPGHTALVDARGLSLSYAQLCGAALRLARRLRQGGARSETVIAVAGGGDAATVLALLAVHFSGATFLPLDPTLPRQRLDAMLAQARPQWVLGPDQAVQAVAHDAWPVLRLDDEAMAELCEQAGHEPLEVALEAPGSSLAYMIYTSGSTGQPKGVQISHAAFTNAVASMIRRPGLNPDDRFASVTTISFDISLLEIFGSLLAGATLYPVERDVARDGRALARMLREQAITVMQATPATWKLLRAEDLHQPGLRVWCGGESLGSDLADWLCQAFGEAWNMYGPTETTIWSSVYRLQPGQVSVGWPIARTGLHVLDAEGDLALPGALGELAISGTSVSRGYQGRPGQTAASFVPSLQGDGLVMYRTGDLACRLEDGSHLILGRLDRQLKVNGFRIEPGDIEHALRQTLGLREAVVGQAAGVEGLCAWLVLADPATLNTEAAHTALAECLPAYMVPKHWIAVPALPLTPNGKIDMKALPPPGPDSQATAPTRSAGDTPSTHAEAPGLAQLVTVLCRLLLKQPGFGVGDDFFAHGGHSLLAMQLRARVEKVAQTDIPLRLLFDARTPLDVAERVRCLPGVAPDLDARALAILQKQPRSTA